MTRETGDCSISDETNQALYYRKSGIITQLKGERSDPETLESNEWMGEGGGIW